MAELNKEALKTLRKKLGEGNQKRIADKLGFTPNYVSMVLRGERNNSEIIDLAVKMAIKTTHKKLKRNETWLKQINKL